MYNYRYKWIVGNARSNHISTTKDPNRNGAIFLQVSRLWPNRRLLVEIPHPNCDNQVLLSVRACNKLIAQAYNGRLLYNINID